MDAKVSTVGEILHAKTQYLVPFFQRYYCWERKDWNRLANDIMRLVADSQQPQHFLGPFVCTQLRSFPSDMPTFQIIDGQQRLTTLMVLLAALRDVAKTHEVPQLPDQIEQDYLVHRWNAGLQRYKLISLLADREAFQSVIDGNQGTENANGGIVDAWRFFKQRWKVLAQNDPETRLNLVFQAATSRLSLVEIRIDHENPYEIFESLNGAGQPLEESGLIKNFLFMKVGLPGQAAFQEQHWQHFENLFDCDDGSPPDVPTTFYRDYLMRLGTYSKKKATFVDFKNQFTERNERGFTPGEQVVELKKFANYELWLEQPEKCQDERVQKELWAIQMLDMTTAHPLLLNLLERYESGVLPHAELLGCMKDLAGFVLRRSICDEQTRGYGRWFVEAITVIHEQPRQDLRDYWFRRGWPDDHIFIARLQPFALYGTKKCRLLLNALEESFEHNERVDLSDSEVQIEHVMPQTIGDEKSGREWKQVLGPDWQRIHRQWLHCLGNLTLTGYNLDLSNKSYSEKRAIYAESHFSLNRYFANVEVWNEEAIKRRGRLLAQKVAQIWSRPPGPYTPHLAEPDLSDFALDDDPPANDEVQGPEGRRQQTRILITIYWPVVKVPKDNETIGRYEPAAKTMAKFLGRLAKELGQDILTRAENFRFGENRRLVSTNPTQDFVQRNARGVYQHKQVPDARHWVMTGIDNDEKKRVLILLLRHLELPLEMCKIEIVNRENLLDELLA